ncbi:Pls/PosA family non-ribosomal peptide synthetase [Pseudonocardia sp. H11422]|uniref:Pls/PosA family non-ribosomal peptide synthetase n=1 Tax=Pseudonocardia sp. H11422 TaxID=2835866 RepID=UPI002930AC0B|nr:Pls/PosA family non-ribosomal peptide synthetase [Pseudonocardia sp. H11422]
MSPQRQTARSNVIGELPGPRSVELLARQKQRSIRLAEQPDTRPLVPMSELVLVDRHEAQGWRVRQDERLDHLFEARCDWAHSYGPAGRLAVDSDELSLTYDELDARANQLARYLRLHGAGGGDRIALLFDRPTDSYIAMLAVLKIGAAYVPLDVSFPAGRMAHIVADAQVRTVLSISHVADRVEQIELLTARGAEMVHLDRAAPLINEQNPRRLIDAERGILDNQLAYIIYTSDSDGRPTGVAVDHPSICNFVKVAAEVYGIQPRDRVYQGLTIAFDFSVEEIWVPWFCGATLVPKPAGASLLGQDLHEFLSEHRVTAMSCVPSLLATIEDDLPALRFLLVSGETCPRDLVGRWYRPGRRILNVYGPSEATVAATWTELHPDKPVTLGVPLPTYNTVILDVEDPYHALPHGEIGEIGIAGIGLARGYLNSDDQTREAFIPDFLGIPGNPTGRIFRTGDLGRVTLDGEIEYHGRIDPRDRTRGYRVELAEIESVLLQVAESAQAVVDTSDPADCSTAQGAGILRISGLATPFAPASPAAPAVPAAPTAFAPPAAPLAPAAPAAPAPVAGLLAEVLGEVLGVEQVPVDSHFFDDLGADSMVMTRFCAKLRKRADLPSASMKDIYRHPTISGLATALAPPAALTAPAVPAAPAALAPPAAPAVPTVPATPAPVAGLLAEVLGEVLGVEQVPVDSHFFDDLGADSMVMTRFCAKLRKRADLPSASMKDIYRHPRISSLATALAPPAALTAPAVPAAPAALAPPAAPAVPTVPATPAPVAGLLAEVLADVLGVEQVPVDSHFFDDLGADSMVMTRFCAKLRKRADLPTVSMKDIYQHTTISSLATALADSTPTPVESSVPARVESSVPARVEVAAPASTLQYVLCGALQLLIFLAYSYLTAVVMVAGYNYIAAGSGLLDDYFRAITFGGAAFLGLSVLPILVKWVLIGRWKPGQQIRIWSLDYVRFWVVKTMVQRNLLVLLFAGSPLYVLYLRALGAKIGRGVVIFSRNVPVCTDLLTIGDGTTILKDTFFNGYRAQSGVIQMGAVTLGRDAFVGEATVLDIDTAVGDGAQLGHTSSLYPGHAVPAGERWHGSPGQRTDVDYRAVVAAPCGSLRRAVYSFVQLLNLLLVFLPLGLGGLDILLTEVPQLRTLLEQEQLALTSWLFYADALAFSFVLFFGPLLFGLVFVAVVPRLLNLPLKPDKVYRLYGIHYSLHRAITRMTNLKLFTALFGDSSAIVHYLRYLGYGLNQVEQTGSNFGMSVKHESPYLSSVGSATVVADGLSIGNADYSNTAFRLSRVSIGAHNFLGNGIVYPAQGRTGDNCLLATKVMIPVDGKIRENVGLLGSPSFEIPRTVERDSQFDHLLAGDGLRRRLAAKNRHNALSMAFFLLARWMYLFGAVLITWSALDFYSVFGTVAIAAMSLVGLLYSVVYWTLLERLFMIVRPLQPMFASIYELSFWRHERFWKVLPVTLVQTFNGTPFKALVWRLLGVRSGRRLFDDGCSMTERTLVTIGDDVTLNVKNVLQCHSQEDGSFKSDRITIGNGCTLGVGAFIHYGVTIGDGAEIAADSFLMKGEEVPPNTRWGGNPAEELPDDTADLQVRREFCGSCSAALVGSR